MVKSELIKRSPLRIFEKTIHGGVGAGKIGVIASRKGVGKTACLVHIATDKLIQDNHVIHVSYAAKVDHIISWYEDIFSEISKKRELEEAMVIHDELIKNRVIMNFNQKGTKIDQVLKSLQVMIKDGHFKADTIIFDGFDFETALDTDLDEVKKFAQDSNLEIWFTATLPAEGDVFEADGTPILLKRYMSRIDVLVTLKHNDNHVKLNVVKDHGNAVSDAHLKLDPKTMLIVEE